jgi:hypothetical protein
METKVKNQWEDLLREARDMGLSIEMVREFLEQMKDKKVVKSNQ